MRLTVFKQKKERNSTLGKEVRHRKKYFQAYIGNIQIVKSTHKPGYTKYDTKGAFLFSGNKIGKKYQAIHANAEFY